MKDRPASPSPRRRKAVEAAGARRGRLRRVLLLLGLVLVAFVGWIVWEGFHMFGMPGTSFAGALPPLSESQVALRDALRRDLERLADDIGERNLFRLSRLRRAESFLESAMQEAGYAVERQGYDVRGTEVYNLISEIRGLAKPDEIVVVGAHYDTVHGCPGANDNGTGVVGLLALARALAGASVEKTVRFVFFVNEEPPYFQTELMGSLVYARRCRERNEKIVGMLSLETIGFYDDAKGSQKYPFPFGLFYPSEGNFVCFVGNRKSRAFIRDVVGSFRDHARFPSEGAALPGFVSAAGWSDQWAFWQNDYPGLMVTDTAPFRYAEYHRPGDTVDKIDFDGFARVMDGVEKVVRELVGP